ncbi:unnamed protein product [Natator depressus]
MADEACARLMARDLTRDEKDIYETMDTEEPTQNKKGEYKELNVMVRKRTHFSKDQEEDWCEKREERETGGKGGKGGRGNNQSVRGKSPLFLPFNCNSHPSPIFFHHISSFFPCFLSSPFNPSALFLSHFMFVPSSLMNYFSPFLLFASLSFCHLTSVFSSSLS